MKNSFSIKFYLNPSKVKDKKCQIYTRIIVDREKAELATNLYVDPKAWNEVAGRTAKTSAVNDELSEIENEIRKLRRQILDENKLFSARLLKQYYKGDKNLKVKAQEYFEKHVEDQRQLAAADKISLATVTAYNTTYKHLCGFIAYKNLGDIYLREIDYSFIINLDVYLKTVYRDKHKEIISTNYVNKSHSRVRTVLHKAVREGIITANPYAKFKLKNEKTTRERLTEEELEKLKRSFLGNRSLEKVRDFFLFSCYTGLRYEDAYNLKMKDILKEPDGSLAVSIIMGKTDGQVYVPLLEPAKEIMLKYAGDDARKVYGYVLPRYSNQKINTYLKTISELAGIDKELTHHVARHTCATYLLNNGVPIEVVQNILGHTDIKATKIYAKMLNSTVKREMGRINEKLKAA